MASSDGNHSASPFYPAERKATFSPVKREDKKCVKKMYHFHTERVPEWTMMKEEGHRNKSNISKHQSVSFKFIELIVAQGARKIDPKIASHSFVLVDTYQVIIFECIHYYCICLCFTHHRECTASTGRFNQPRWSLMHTYSSGWRRWSVKVLSIVKKEILIVSHTQQYK